MRHVVDASTEPKEPIVRIGGVRHRRIPLRKQPAALAEVVGLQIAGLRALARQGVVLTLDEVEKLEKLARTVASISSAHTRLNKPDDEDPDKLSTEQLQKRAGG